MTKLAKRFPTLNVEFQLTFLEVLTVVKRLNCGMDSYFQSFGLSQAGFKVMMNLYYDEQNEGLSPATLSESLSVTRATVTGVLDTLENNGWIERRPDPNDRRGLLIRLTDGGRQKLETILPTHYGRISNSMALLSLDEQKTLRRLMQKFSQGLDALEESAKDIKKEDDQ